eukprot:3634285-Amphidinium_carterae.1
MARSGQDVTPGRNTCVSDCDESPQVHAQRQTLKRPGVFCRSAPGLTHFTTPVAHVMLPSGSMSLALLRTLYVVIQI